MLEVQLVAQGGLQATASPMATRRALKLGAAKLNGRRMGAAGWASLQVGEPAFLSSHSFSPVACRLCSPMQHLGGHLVRLHPQQP